ncbi:hypothetical protein Tco_0390505 [Tanacetum coccineum]
MTSHCWSGLASRFRVCLSSCVESPFLTLLVIVSLGSTGGADSQLQHEMCWASLMITPTRTSRLEVDLVTHNFSTFGYNFGDFLSDSFLMIFFIPSKLDSRKLLICRSRTLLEIGPTFN